MESNWLSNRWNDFLSIFKSTKKTVLFFLLASSTVVCMVLSYQWFVYLENHVTTEDSYLETDIFPVNSRYMGYVNKVNAEEGSLVHKDDILAEIDDTDVKVELSFKEMKFKKAQGDLNRAENLHKSNALSQFDYENALAAFKASEVDLEATKLKLKYTKILASSDGIVAKKNLLPGQFIQPGQVLFMIVDTQHPWVRASFKETQIQYINTGAKVSIHIDAYPEIELIGQVENIYPSSDAKLSILPPENSTGNFTKIVQRIPLKISLDPNSIAKFDKNVLRAGMSVGVSIDVTKNHTPGLIERVRMGEQKTSAQNRQTASEEKN